jgi:hypothetical protein
MFGFLTVAEGDIAVAVVCLVLGVAFSTKIKDWFKGIPADVRTALNGVETSALSNVKAAQTHVLSQLATALPPIVKPPVTAAVIPALVPAPVALVASVAPEASH